MLSLHDGVEQAVKGMNRYGSMHSVWQIGYSGGKDSACLLSLLVWLVAEKRIPEPEKCYITMVDTLQEVPPLIDNMRTLASIAEGSLGWVPIFIQPAIEDSFLFQMFGRGLYTPGSNRNRWCTRKLKSDPMRKGEWKRHYDVEETTTLTLYGSRIDESDTRRSNMLRSCTLEGSECGMGLYMENEGPKYAPLSNWRNCSVWEWLVTCKKRIGYDPSPLIDLYASIDGDAVLDSISTINGTARTGCLGCPLVAEDLALDRLCKHKRWEHLKPFKGLHKLYLSMRDHKKRHRKPPGVKGGRVGPLTLEARLDGLETVKAMQIESYRIADANGVQRFTLLSDELEYLIRKAIRDKVYPRGWDGSEPVAESSAPSRMQIFNAF